MNAEGQETTIDIRLTQIDANENWTAAQRSDSILAKIMAAKVEDKRPTRIEISAESSLKKAFWTQFDSLRLVNGCLYHIYIYIYNSDVFLQS